MAPRSIFGCHFFICAPKIAKYYHFGTKNYDYKGLVMNSNEKFFRVEKLKFLAPLTRLLGQRELRTRCCPERPQMALKHFPWVYYMNICHVGPPWGHSGTHGGLKWPKPAPKWPRMAQNHQSGSKWHCMTPNDLKHFPWVYNIIICHFGPPWTLFSGPRGPQNGPKQHQNGLL